MSGPVPWRELFWERTHSVPLPGDELEGRTSRPRWKHRRELFPFEEGYMDEEFYEEDEDGQEILALFHQALPDRTLPSAAFLRQVREATVYHYEGGHYPEGLPESVAKYLEPDGGLLRTLELAIALLEEREQAGGDASVVEQIAIRLAQQNSAHADGDWNDPNPQGWADGEARRQAYREMALEILRLATPRMMQIFTDRCADQLLPQFRDIVTKLRSDA